MSNRELTSMRQGTLRGGWTVEHIKARCFDIPALPKNRLGNLIIMPFDLNAWTAKLEQIQKPNLFKAGGRHRRRLMICAEPVNGPRQDISCTVRPLRWACRKIGWIKGCRWKSAS